MKSGVPSVAQILLMLVWGLLVLGASVALSSARLWWLVLVFGAVMPVVLVVLPNGAARTPRSVPASRADKERELLSVLDRYGEVGPVLVAMETKLTVTEADEMLGNLAKKGYLEARVRDGAWGYALPLREQPDPGSTITSNSSDRPEYDEEAVDLPGDEPVTPRPVTRETPQTLAEPLTEREREVLALMASGRTNREIAADLFVSVGTVKAHAAHIYRKLGARNRAEAMAKSRDLGLLR